MATAKKAAARKTARPGTRAGVGSMPMGRLAVTSCMACLIFLPKVRMSPPSRIAIARPMAGSPFTRNIGCGGSA